MTVRTRVVTRALRGAVVAAVFSASVFGAAVFSLSRSASWALPAPPPLTSALVQAAMSAAHIAPPVRLSLGAPISRRAAVARASLTLDTLTIAVVSTLLFALVLSVAIAFVPSWITRYSSRASRTRGQPCMAA